ncbi:MAG: enoyl-CoA hydratase [bacterium]|nr:enoyl-CoA hydratase [bacterium]
MNYQHLKVSQKGRVGRIQLHRPEALNALCAKLTQELTHVFEEFGADESIGSVLLSGSEKAFAAGADIKEMQAKTYQSTYQEDFITKTWEAVAKCRKPVIAAVSGYALGGGCEIAMMCDILIAAENVKFGQPEITIGTLPGAGGTQRLTRAIGKAKAMDMCLTGRMMDVEEAERAGLVSRIVSVEDLEKEALAVAEKVASMSLPAAMMVKECVNQSQEMGLSQGLLFERRVFHSSFALKDQKEGMQAFIEKRPPKFQHG